MVGVLGEKHWLQSGSPLLKMLELQLSKVRPAKIVMLSMVAQHMRQGCAGKAGSRCQLPARWHMWQGPLKVCLGCRYAVRRGMSWTSSAHSYVPVVIESCRQASDELH